MQGQHNTITEETWAPSAFALYWPWRWQFTVFQLQKLIVKMKVWQRWICYLFKCYHVGHFLHLNCSIQYWGLFPLLIYCHNYIFLYFAFLFFAGLPEVILQPNGRKRTFQTWDQSAQQAAEWNAEILWFTNHGNAGCWHLGDDEEAPLWRAR